MGTNYAIEAARTALENASKDASRALAGFNGVSSVPMGLTPDAVKADPAYIALRNASGTAFNALRNFNTKYKPASRSRAR